MKPFKEDCPEDPGSVFLQQQIPNPLKKIYGIIDSLEKTEVEVKAFAEYNDLYLWFTVAGMVLLSCSIVRCFKHYDLLRIPLNLR